MMKPRVFLQLFQFSCLVLLGLAGCQSGSTGFPDVNEAAFVTQLGDDTLAVEQFQQTDTVMQAEVVLRTPETTVRRYRLVLDESGALRRYEAATLGADASTLRREVFVPMGDSLQVTVTEEGQDQVRMIEGDAQMLPFIDMVHWPFELMLMRAYSSGQDSVTQQLFTGRGAMPFVVRRVGDHQMTVTHPFRGTMVVDVDGQGRLVSLDAGATTRALIVRRVPEINLDDIASRFARLDTEGKAFGPLSGRGEETAQVKGARIRIDFGRPSKRGRVIFGELVPWGELWRTGANQATHFETDRALTLGGLNVPPGQYTLYTIPEPDGGTLIVNRQTGQGGTTYDQAQDLGRVDMIASTLPETVEDFTIDVEGTDEGGILKLQWDRTEFSVPFTVQ